MFYFSLNPPAGFEMGRALLTALSWLEQLVRDQAPPFTALIGKCGDVALRDNFK
jgi:hypothetical protein